MIAGDAEGVLVVLDGKTSQARYKATSCSLLFRNSHFSIIAFCFVEQ